MYVITKFPDTFLCFWICFRRRVIVRISLVIPYSCNEHIILFVCLIVNVRLHFVFRPLLTLSLGVLFVRYFIIFHVLFSPSLTYNITLNRKSSYESKQRTQKLCCREKNCQRLHYTKVYITRWICFFFFELSNETIYIVYLSYWAGF